jgi:hypothetical protein
MPRDFIAAVQFHIARASVMPSALRGAGSAGTAECAREFLGSLPLKSFGVSSAQLFRDRLDAATDALLSELPPKAKKWGRTRKILNIFLRNALYSTHLSRRFVLDRAEYLLELPLDGLTAKELKSRYEIPEWPGVAALTPELSAQFQDAAEKEGKKRHMARVHLDVYWWGGRYVEDEV